MTLLTGVLAAATLAWSLRIEAGDPLFYPATFGLAVIYLVGSRIAVGLDGGWLPWRPHATGIGTAALWGIGLAVLFMAGAFMIRFVPPLGTPVHELLDHARVGNVALVALSTAVNGVTEEVYYRGALWRVVTPRRRILITTVAYTLVTALAGVALLAFAAAVLGFVVAVLRERTESVVPCIVAHLVWSMSMLFVLPRVV